MKAIHLNIIQFVLWTITATIFSLASSVAAAPNQEVFVLLPEKASAVSRTNLGKALQHQLGTASQPNDVLHFIKAPNHQHISTLVVPSGSANRRLRNPQLRTALKPVIQYLKADVDRGSQQLELPSLPTTVRALRRTEYPARIVLFGTPVYENATHHLWNMDRGLVPKDESLKSAFCPFGSRVADFPSGTKVVWVTAGVRFGDDFAHQEALTRFYSLFFREHEASLLQITNSFSTAFSLGDLQLKAKHVAKKDGVGMRQVSLPESIRIMGDEGVVPDTIKEVKKKGPVVQLPRKVEKKVPVDQLPDSAVKKITSARRFTPAAPKASAEKVLARAQLNKNKIAFAINWTSDDPNCDIDMRFRSKGHREEMYYRHRKSTFGFLYRDVTGTKQFTQGDNNYQNWEWAEINHDRLQDITFWLNNYRGLKPSKVRLICVWKGERREQIVNFKGISDSGVTVPYFRPYHGAWHKVSLNWDDWKKPSPTVLR